MSIKQKMLNLLFVALFALAAAGIGVVASNGMMVEAAATQLVCGGSAGGGC